MGSDEVSFAVSYTYIDAVLHYDQSLEDGESRIKVSVAFVTLFQRYCTHFSKVCQINGPVFLI